MSAFTDRLYSSWLVDNGSEKRLHLAHVAGGQVGAQRRSRPEGYPRDQARQPARDAGASRDGRSLEGAPRRGGGAAPVEVPDASCGPFSLPREAVRP